MVLLALGPTTTILASGVSRRGIEYEWFLKGAANKISVPGKHVNEVAAGRDDASVCNDENYHSQIVVLNCSLIQPTMLNNIKYLSVEKGVINMIQNEACLQLNDTPKVSIVIPVYNVEKYIEKCLHSLQKQTIEDLEFIFVDDCGSDQSIAIVEKAAETDSRIRILYNKSNMGAGKTRNRGIVASRGEYIAFVDPDDWVDDHFYEILYNRAVEGNYDIVKANRIKAIHREDGAVRYEKSTVNNSIIEGMSAGDPLYLHFTSEHQSAIFRSSLIKDNHIYNGCTSHSENSVFLLKACYFCLKFCLESNVSYYYFQREDSSVHIFNKRRFEDEIISFNEQLDFMNEIAIKRDQFFFAFLKKKLLFLFKRYDELRKTPSLHNYHRQYVEELCDAIDRIGEKQKLKSLGVKIRLLVDRKIRLFTFIFRFNSLLSWVRSSQGVIKGKYKEFRRVIKKHIKNTILYRIYKRRYSVAARFLNRFQNREIVYIQNFRGCIMFCKKFLEIDPDFASSYINGFIKNSGNYNCNLLPSSQLYQEHLEKAQKGEICWRCVKRFGYVSKTTVYLTDDNTLSFRGEILGSAEKVETKYFIIHPQKERSLIKGQVLKEFLAEKGSYYEVLGEVRQYLDFLFNSFEMRDQTKIHGLSYDAFPYNCIIKDGHEYELFDLEFEYKGELDKGYMIYKTVKTLPLVFQKPVYYEICEHYGFVANWEQWEAFNFRLWLETVFESPKELSQENAAIFAKYFIA